MEEEEEEVRRRDLRAGARACQCVLGHCDVNNNSFHSAGGPECRRRCRKSLFLPTRRNARRRRNDFYFEDVSHSGDYIPLHLRGRRRLHLSAAALTTQRPSANFTAGNYNAELSQWQFTASRSFRLSSRCTYISAASQWLCKTSTFLSSQACSYGTAASATHHFDDT